MTSRPSWPRDVVVVTSTCADDAVMFGDGVGVGTVSGVGTGAAGWLRSSRSRSWWDLTPNPLTPGPVLNLGSPSKTKSIRRDADGRPLARSIIGSVAAFEEIDALENGDEYMEPPPPTTIAGRLTPTPASPLASSRPGSRPKSHTDPALERKKYLDHLIRTMQKSQSIRDEGAQRERELLELLPVNEQFGMNREAKVMARWKVSERRSGVVGTVIVAGC